MVSQARRLHQRLCTADNFSAGPVFFYAVALTIQDVWQAK
jgi:hypothetical protein